MEFIKSVIFLVNLTIYPFIIMSEVKHPTGFTNLERCIEKEFPVKFLLSEADSEQFILILQNGIVINEGGLITCNGEIFEDTETYKNDQQNLLQKNRNIAEEPILFFDGKLVVISSPGQENWYHWLFQVIPRLKIMAESGIKYDKIYINNLKYSWQRQSLAIVMEKLGIETDSLLLVEGDTIIQATTLIVPSVPFILSKERKIFPEWLKKFIQNIFFVDDKENTIKRIYISRSKAKVRRIANENELIKFLEKFGFVALNLEDLSIQDQARYFHNAHIIIGPHGSGFANLIFCRPNISIIEIDHELDDNNQRSFFKKMAEIMKCNYIPFYVDKVDEENLENDMYVDLESFEKFLQSKAI